jgi:hypothetical protein
MNYAVICLDATTSQVDVLAVYGDEKSALWFLSTTIEKIPDYSDPYYFRKITDSATVVSIWQVHVWSKRTLVKRYFITQLPNQTVHTSMGEVSCSF